MIPKARIDGLKIESTSRGVIVKDPKTGMMHQLNLLRSMVWNYCDGKKSPYEIGNLVRSQFGDEIDEDTIWSELTKLFMLGLLLDDSEDAFHRYARM